MSCGRQQQFSAAEAERIMTHRNSFKPAAGKLKSWEAVAIMGVTDRTTRRWRERLNEHGYSSHGITRSECR